MRYSLEVHGSSQVRTCSIRAYHDTDGTTREHQIDILQSRQLAGRVWKGKGELVDLDGLAGRR